jgi:cyclopropane-fatty-acyl-phospholipid synthase
MPDRPAMMHGMEIRSALAVEPPSKAAEIPHDLPFLVRRVLGVARDLRAGRLEVVLPDGRRLAFQGAAPGPNAVLAIRNLRFAERLARAGDLGLAESHLRGEWDSPDLATLLALLAANDDRVRSLARPHAGMRLWRRLRHALNRNTRLGARRNIRAHYDLGNHFYAAWLDPGMTYSAGLFAPGDDDLESAQARKYRRLADALDLRPGQKLLDIGCGWGGFAEFAARDRGCRVTGLTISREQRDYAASRIQAAGLSDLVTIELRDYRDERGVYDRIASIEMFEAVGEAYWPLYFRQLRDRLREGGRAGLQVITLRDDRVERYRREVDFIRRHVFPGGMLTSARAMRRLGAEVGLSLRDEFAFGMDYARTLAAWRERFGVSWVDLASSGFDERFRRLWTYYLAYCEAGFRTGIIDVRQMTFDRP